MVHPNQTSDRRKAGYTLLEALVVIAIIGIGAALAAPALSIAMADRRASEATHRLVRIGARARSEAMAYGRAHLLRYAQGEGDGVVDVWRGVSNLCVMNNWSAIAAGECKDSLRCLEALDMRSYDQGTHRVRMRAPEGVTALCFQPDGEVLVSNDGGATFTPPAPGAPTADGVTFTFDRLENGAPAGVQRAVVFPFGATPRIVR